MYTYTTIVREGHIFYEFVEVSESDPPGIPMFETKELAMEAANQAKFKREILISYEVKDASP
jgi:hypothetical protein